MNKFKSTAFTLALLALLGVGLWSCGNDDDSPAATSPIVGTWVYENHTVNATINGQNSLQFLIENLGLTETEAMFVENMFLDQAVDDAEFQGFSAQFRADGTYQITDQDGGESGTYELRNNNTVLALNDGDELVELQVTELTNSHMTVVFEEDDEFDILGDGEFENILLQFTLRLQKQN